MTYLVASVYSTHFHYAFLDILNQPVCAEYPPVGDLFRSAVGQLFFSSEITVSVCRNFLSIEQKKKHFGFLLIDKMATFLHVTSLHYVLNGDHVIFCHFAAFVVGEGKYN